MVKPLTYLDARIAALNTILDKTPRSFREKTFHALRVELKKTRFVIALARHCHKLPGTLHGRKTVKKIFRKAGKVRDLQIVLLNLREYTDDVLFRHFKNHLRRKLKQNRVAFFALIKECREKLMLFLNKCRAPVSRITGADVKKYSVVHQKAASNYRQMQVLSNDGLHEWRKVLKKITYAEAISSSGKSKNETYTEQASDLLGKWHDGIIVLHCIRSYLQAEKRPENEIVFFTRIRKKLQLSLKNQLEKLVNLAPGK